MPLMKMERDACKTKRKLSRGLTNWRNIINVRVTLKLCIWRALNCARVSGDAAALLSQVSLNHSDRLVDWQNLLSSLFSVKNLRWFILYHFVKSWILLTTVYLTLYLYFLKLYPPHHFWLTLLTRNPDVNNQMCGFFFS